MKIVALVYILFMTVYKLHNSCKLTLSVICMIHMANKEVLLIISQLVRIASDWSERTG